MDEEFVDPHSKLKQIFFGGFVFLLATATFCALLLLWVQEKGYIEYDLDKKNALNALADVKAQTKMLEESNAVLRRKMEENATASLRDLEKQLAERRNLAETQFIASEKRYDEMVFGKRKSIADLEAYSSSITEALKGMQEQIKTHNELTNRVALAQTRARAAEADLASVRDEVSKKRGELSALSLEIDEAKTNYAKIKEDGDNIAVKLRQAREGMQKRNQQLEDDAEKAEKREAVATAAARKAEQRLSNLMAEYAVETNLLALARAENGRYQQTLASNKAMAEEQLSKALVASNSLALINAQVETQTMALSKANNDLATANGVLTGLSNEIKGKRSELAEVNTALEQSQIKTKK